MNTPDPACLDLATAAALIARREVAATDLVEHMLARIERLNPRLNAYITVLSEAALAEASKADKELSQDIRADRFTG